MTSRNERDCFVCIGGMFLLDAMTASVEQAVAVLICLSNKYQNSLKCKSGKSITRSLYL